MIDDIVGSISKLEAMGCEWEVYLVENRSISVVVEGGKLKSVYSSRDVSVALRVIVDGKIGFASGNGVEDVEDIANIAFKIARVSEDRMSSLPPAGKVRKVEGIYDRKVENIVESPEEVKAEIDRIQVERAIIALASISHSVGRVSIVNSNGVECEEESTSSSFFIEAVYNGGSGYEGEESRRAKLNIEKAASKAEELAVLSSKAEKIESGRYTVILEPIAVHQLFSNALYPSFSAENVYKGRSTVKIGNVYGEISIVDDPLLEGGLYSTSFDDEGVPSRKTPLVENGVVRNFYTDWKYAEKMGIDDTSNGYRASPSSPPAPLPSNIVLDGESAETDGLVVHSLIGAHTSNPVSGDFSVECMNAVYAKRGEEVAVKGAMLYGNVFETLAGVIGFTGERRQIENTLTASIVIENLRVV